MDITKENFVDKLKELQDKTNSYALSTTIDFLLLMFKNPDNIPSRFTLMNIYMVLTLYDREENKRIGDI